MNIKTNLPIFHISVDCGIVPSHRRVEILRSIHEQVKSIDYAKFIVTDTNMTITRLNLKEENNEKNC